MPFYTRLGEIPRKRHVQFRRPDGKLYSEEVFGTEGFVGPTSTLYHINPPTQVHGWKPLYSTKVQYVEEQIMRMRHVKTSPMKPSGDPVTGRVVLFGNADCEMAVCLPRQQMNYHYKNGQGDECLFIHYGSGTCYTMFGTLKFGPKDYIIIPKGTIYKLVFDEPKSLSRPVAEINGEKQPPGGGLPPGALAKFLVIETVNGSHIGPPPRYVSKTTSQFLEHAPYCERDLRLPELPLVFNEYKDKGFEVRIKARDHVHSYFYDYHPLDVVGWDGCYYPYIFNIDDFSPITGKLHMPPPIHQTFEAHNFVICSFCPRMLDYHPQAIKVPYNHSNLDSDEVLYYVEGNFGSRKGIEIGSLTAHPQGIPHGPHPGTVELSLSATYTQELAVMCDTFRPLFPTKAALGLDDPKYPDSWQGEHYPRLTSGDMRLPDTAEVLQTGFVLPGKAVEANVWAPGTNSAAGPANGHANGNGHSNGNGHGKAKSAPKAKPAKAKRR
ncbi:MAG: homogentisate 1,2-dioxygenase [Planctomycetaceae bacterium]|jgi:homogentisate 1,2-dioxygenase|nr:homogentisate 1,2-dioxygenase [Planctomycetaceae bacterium]